MKPYRLKRDEQNELPKPPDSEWVGVDGRRLVRCLQKVADELEKEKEYNARLCEELREGMFEAWKIIDILYMDALDNNGESWPRAREWQEKWAIFSANDKVLP